MLNGLLNAYVGCIDDAADLIHLGIEKQENIRNGVDKMAAKSKEFLELLNKWSTAPEKDTFKDNLDDAIEGTRDALKEAEAAKKKSGDVTPPTTETPVTPTTPTTETTKPAETTTAKADKGDAAKVETPSAAAAPTDVM